MTLPQHIGAVRIPRPWESEADLRQLQGLDLHAMTPGQLERERRRLSVALGIGSDAELGESMYCMYGDLQPLTVERYLEGRLALVRQLLASCGAR